MAVFHGGPADDSVVGTGHNDKFFGEGGDDTLIGNGGDDVLNGGSGNDTLVGGSGADLLKGGSGNDYIFDHSGGSTVYGGGGSDYIDLLGSNTVYGGGGDDTVLGGDSADLINGGSGHNELYGYGGNDTIVGGKGPDDITGGAGQDQLTGGGGRDYFYFDYLTDSAPSAPDTITDLTNTDVIFLRHIDADTTRSGDQAFHLVSAFDGHAGELTVTYDAADNRTVIQGDVNGDGKADLTIYATGDHHDFTHFAL